MKRLILCCDGTWPSARQGSASNTNPSNVARLSRMLDRQGAAPGTAGGDDDVVAQIVYYQGSTASPSPSLSPLRQLLPQDASSSPSPTSSTPPTSGLEHDIAAAYHFLATNYSPGASGVPADEIFVFGGSRGALVARVVVGLVTEMGLLRRERLGLWPKAWGLWTGRQRERRGVGGAVDADRTTRTTFWKEVVALKSAKELAEIEDVMEGMWPAPGVSIKVVGVWDTVGELGYPETLFSKGAPGDERCRLHDTALNSRIENAFQALALDEHRAAFAPTLWHFDPEYHSNITLRTPNLRQCWFPGFHETVGGCGGGDRANAKDRTDIADITLAWMCDQVDGLLSFNKTAVAEFLGYIGSSSIIAASDDSTLKKDATAATKPLLSIGQLVVAILTSLAELTLYITGVLLPDADDKPAMRTPGQYHKTTDFATNESMHPSIQHRRDMFALAPVPYDPAPLREWPPLDDRPRAHQRRQRRRSAWKSIEEDEKEASDVEVNEINAAATKDFLQQDQHYPTAAGKTPSWPAAWRYRENDDGYGAEWVRPPSLPRLLSSESSPSPPPTSPTADFFRPLLPSPPTPTTTPPSTTASILHLFSVIFFWPLHLTAHLFPHLFPFLPAAPSPSPPSSSPSPPQHPSHHHDRPLFTLALPEWVIREIPGRTNFEAQLLPWLVREQLRRRNGRRLDWRVEGVWTRKAFGVVVAPVEEEKGEEEENDMVGERFDAVEDVDGAEEEGPKREKVKRTRIPSLSLGSNISVATTTTTTAATVGRRRSLHARKVSSGSGSGSGSNDGGSGSTGRSGGGSGGRRAQSMSAGSPGVVVMRGGGVGRVSPASLTNGGGGGGSLGRGSPNPAGRGLRALPQQPVRRLPVRREQRDEAVYTPGHRKSQSQSQSSSVGWR